ncbi:MAG: HEAT repeat domain-containing protein [Planctomycetota bacterium]|nr:HEAT repeat domain-containing protein [Planctomycetota bacterium]
MDNYLNRLKRLAHIDPKNPELRGRLGRAEEQAGADFDGQSLADRVQNIGAWDFELLAMSLKAVTESGAASAPYLHELVLNSDDYWTRRRALEALGRIESLTVGTLIRALSDRSGSIRYLSARFLGNYGVLNIREALPALLRLLDDEKWYVRREAALALGAIRTRFEKDPQHGVVELEELTSQLRAHLEDPEPRVRVVLEALL